MGSAAYFVSSNIILVKHTAASISLCKSNEPSVLTDMNTVMDRIVPSDGNYSVCMKSALIGSSQTIPITDGQLNMGTWQGIWLCEHQTKPEPRNLVITLSGLLK